MTKVVAQSGSASPGRRGNTPSARKPETIESVADAMRAVGQQARQAARELALASSEAKNAALLTAAREMRAQTAAILEANARDLAAVAQDRATAAFLDRLTLDPRRIEAHGQGPRGDRGAARSGRQRDRRWTRPNGLADRARARAARRHRHHLREPAERDGRRRRAVPQGRQRRDPARRLGEPSFQPGHPGVPGARPARGGPARRRHPAGADHRPRGRRADAEGPRWLPST